MEPHWRMGSVMDGKSLGDVRSLRPPCFPGHAALVCWAGQVEAGGRRLPHGAGAGPSPA